MLKYTSKSYPTKGYDYDNLGNGVAADFDLDGLTDIAYSMDISNGGRNDYFSPVGIFKNTGSEFVPYKIIIDGVPNQFPQVKFGMYTVVYDINQDGIPDIIPIDQSEVPGTQGTFAGNFQYAYISLTIGSYRKVQIGNDKYGVHGWGIINSQDNKFRILFNTPWTENHIGGVSTVISTYDSTTQKFTSDYFTSKSRYYDRVSGKDFFYQTTLDINNDGNSDIIGFSSSAGHNVAYLNDGNGKFSYYKHIDTGLPPNVHIEEVAVGDFNGDKLPDIVVFGVDRRTPDLNKHIRVLINQNGTDLVDQTEQFLGKKYQNMPASYAYLDTCDVNLDGISDFALVYFPNVNNTGTTLFDVCVSDGSKFKVYTKQDAVLPRVIPLDSNTFYDGKKLIDIAISQGTAQYNSDTSSKAFRIYKAAFDRSPDTAGLNYWIARMDGGMDLVEVSARFIDSAEFKSNYGQNATHAEFLTRVYNNVLDRDPDQAGLAWWVNEMTTNTDKSWAKVLADFAESSENQYNVASLIADGWI